MTAKIMNQGIAPSLHTMVTKITFSRYPGQIVYCTNLHELNQVLGTILNGEFYEAGASDSEFDFDDLMESGEEINIEMEYVPLDFLKKLQDFKGF